MGAVGGAALAYGIDRKFGDPGTRHAAHLGAAAAGGLAAVVGGAGMVLSHLHNDLAGPAWRRLAVGGAAIAAGTMAVDALD
jgi:hypothetical protein